MPTMEQDVNISCISNIHKFTKCKADKKLEVPFQLLFIMLLYQAKKNDTSCIICTITSHCTINMRIFHISILHEKKRKKIRFIILVL